MFRKILLSLLFLCILQQTGVAEELRQVPVAIQISSKISDGKYTISEIVHIAKKNAMQAVIITERDLMRWEYGLWPLRNLIKKKVETGSVLRYGVLRYLQDIDTAQKNNPDILVLGGIESAPFYYWQGFPLDDTFSIHNWHKHMLVFGLKSTKDYLHLPVIGNKRGLVLPFRFKNVFYLLWPLFMLFAGILLIFKKQFSYRDEYGRRLGPYARKSRWLGLVIVIVACFFLIDNFPFLDVRFSQYEGDLGVMPYQNLIDYVNQKHGLTFWAHPEAKNIERNGRITIETNEHTADLLETESYTGFAVFYEGYEKVGTPGGIWDEILQQYCRGVRKKPVWAIGGLSFDSSGDLDGLMKDLRNICLVPQFNQAELIDAFREGRNYVVKGKLSSQFILDKFVVRNQTNSLKKIMGQEIEVESAPFLEISGHFLHGQPQPFKIRLIRGGKVIQSFDADSSFDITFKDEQPPGEKKTYYRLEIGAGDFMCITNPIFVVYRK